MRDAAHFHSARLLAVGIGLALAACTGPEGPPGEAANCTVVTNADATRTITCSDGTTATITNGAAGTPCTVADKSAGVKTITCGETSVDIADGATGEGCTSESLGDGQFKISCGATNIIVSDGQPGTTGTPGGSCSASTLADGAKVVNCDDGTSITIVAASNALAWNAPLPGAKVTILAVTGGTGTGGNFKAGDTVAVKFKAVDNADKVIPLTALSRAGVWFSGPKAGYQHILPAAAKSYDVKATPVAVNNGDGTYTYTFPAPIPANFPAQLNSTAAFASASKVGTPLVDGTYTVSLVVRRDFVVDEAVVRDVGSAQADVLFGTATTLETREVVADTSCNSCHKTVQGHGGGYRATALCITCHTAGTETTATLGTATTSSPVSVEFPVMIHKIHSGLHLPSVQGIGVDATGARTYATSGTPYGFETDDLSGILYPVFPSFNIARPRNLGYSALTSANKTKEDNLRKGVTNCNSCHEFADDGARANSVPSRRACGACHDDIDWTKPYMHNGQTMPANQADSTCIGCHSAEATAAAHLHPLENPATNGGLVFDITNVAGGTAAAPVGNFKNGDKVSVVFTLKDTAGNNVAPSALDAITSLVVGPNQNRNVVFPMASASGVSTSPFDVASGRLVALSTSNKGTMSKVIEGGGTAVTETLKVAFTTATAFDVTGTASGALGNGSLLAKSTNPSGASVGSVVLAPDVAAQKLQVKFTTPTAFTVYTAADTTPVSIGSGALSASTAASVLFKSTDNKIQFIVTVGSAAFTANQVINLTVFKGDVANTVLFAVIAGSSDFASGDRFYYDYVAPRTDGIHTMKVPMDIPWETIGYGTNSQNQAFTAAANLPVYYGRQTVYEAAPATFAAAVNTVVKPYERWAYLTDTTGLAKDDFLVFEPGTSAGVAGATEEYLRITSVDPSIRKVMFTTVFRYQHNPGAIVKKVTATMLQEANDYTLAPATGVITLAGTKVVPAANAIFMTYRTDGAFGWKMKAGGTLVSVYGPAVNTTGVFAEPWQVWTGKPYLDGTYTVAMWGQRNIYVGEQGEVQTYRGTATANDKDFLFGTTASTITPYALISDAANCNNCHKDLSFHGGGRRGAEACLTCHGTAGLENGSGTNYTFKNFIHAAHVEALPAMPGGSKQCSMCHGNADAYKDPTDHTYPGATNAAFSYSPACSGCHDVISSAGGAHIDSMVSQTTNVESCAVCHGPGKELSIERMHTSK